MVLHMACGLGGKELITFCLTQRSNLLKIRGDKFYHGTHIFMLQVFFLKNCVRTVYFLGSSAGSRIHLLIDLLLSKKNVDDVE